MLSFHTYEIDKNSPFTTAALLARISAGESLEIESVIERVDLNELLTRGSDATLLLRVNGDSMEDVPIFSGDYVILDRLRQPEASDIIVARLNGGYIIKRHKLNDERGRKGLFLVPANQAHKSKKITQKDDNEILGVVTFIIHPAI